MPQEPAYAAERRQDAEAKAASERAQDRMSEASVRRRGMGGPELLPQEVARYPRECRPHSVFALPLQRPARSSSPAPIARVQGWQPMLT